MSQESRGAVFYAKCSECPLSALRVGCCFQLEQPPLAGQDPERTVTQLLQPFHSDWQAQRVISAILN
jgi:hypothetical protein